MRISSNEFCCSFRIYASTCSAMAWLRLKLFFSQQFSVFHFCSSRLCILKLLEIEMENYIFWFEWCFSPSHRHHYGSKKSTLAIFWVNWNLWLFAVCVCVFGWIYKRDQVFIRTVLLINFYENFHVVLKCRELVNITLIYRSYTCIWKLLTQCYKHEHNNFCMIFTSHFHCMKTDI